MSVCDSRGVQLHPDDLTETSDPLRALVVQFTDCSTHTTVGEMCGWLGVPTRDLARSMRELVASGWLTPQPDGTYLATIPTEASL